MYIVNQILDNGIDLIDLKTSKHIQKTSRWCQRNRKNVIGCYSAHTYEDYEFDESITYIMSMKDPLYYKYIKSIRYKETETIKKADSFGAIFYSWYNRFMGDTIQLVDLFYYKYGNDWKCLQDNTLYIEYRGLVVTVKFKEPVCNITARFLLFGVV